MSKQKKIVRSGLGRGLDALFSEKREEHVEDEKNVSKILIKDILPNPYQPRKQFDESSLQELANSLRENGLIQPITVAKKEKGFQLVSGERRWRAASLVGLKEIDAYVIEAEERALMEMALIENIQREDLNAVEIAESYQQIMLVMELTHEELAQKVGKDRATITNYLRLLKLPERILEAVRNGEISMGHARALLSLELDQMLFLFEKIIQLNLSVRDTERHIKNLKKATSPKKAVSKEKTKDTDLSEYFHTDVEVLWNEKGEGTVQIPYENRETLERILQKLKK